jgi:hypothetical protein
MTLNDPLRVVCLDPLSADPPSMLYVTGVAWGFAGVETIQSSSDEGAMLR